MKHEITNLDTDQCTRYTYDEASQAQRVIVTNDFGISDAIKESLKNLTIQPSTAAPTQQNIERIEIPMPIYKTEFIQIPTILKEMQIVEVEKTIIIKEYEKIEVPVEKTVYKEVQVPIITKEIQYIEPKQPDNKLLHILIGLQTMILIILTISQFLK